MAARTRSSGCSGPRDTIDTQSPTPGMSRLEAAGNSAPSSVGVGRQPVRATRRRRVDWHITRVPAAFSRLYEKRPDNRPMPQASCSSVRASGYAPTTLLYWRRQLSRQ